MIAAIETLREYQGRLQQLVAAFDSVIAVMQQVNLEPEAPKAAAAEEVHKTAPVRKTKALRERQLTVREYVGRNERYLMKAVEAQPGEFRNKDLVEWLLKHEPEAGRHLERKTGAVACFVTKLKEQGWVEFVRKDGVAVFNRKTKAFRSPVDPVEKHERFKREVLGMPTGEVGGE